MTNEFTAYCSHYYQLKMLFLKRQDRLKNLLDNAPFYSGQISLSEIDAIVSYYREAQAAKAKMDKTLADMKEAERDILMFMRHFDIPPARCYTAKYPANWSTRYGPTKMTRFLLTRSKTCNRSRLPPIL